MLYNEVKILNYTIDDALILTTSLFPAFLQVHVSETFVSVFSLTPTVRFLYWPPDVCFNGFMYFEILPCDILTKKFVIKPTEGVKTTTHPTGDNSSREGTCP